MNRTTLRLGGATSALLVLAPLTAGVALAAPPAGDRVVGSADWAAQAYNCDGDYTTPRQADVYGPEHAPFGSGSRDIRIGESSQQTELYRTAAYDGVKVGDLARLDYSTRARYADIDGNTDGPARQPAYLRLTVDKNADGTPDDALFYFPANNGTVQQNVWQSWATIDGRFGQGGDSNYTTLADYVAANPQAVIANNAEAGQSVAAGGGLALIVGCGQGGSSDPQINGVYKIDRVIVGLKDGSTTLFDLGKRDEQTGDTTERTVNPENRQGWDTQTFDAATNGDLATTATFVKGPGTPPLGVGSLRFSVDGNDNRVEQFRTARYDGRHLRDLRTADYSTFQRATGENQSPQQPVYLRLNVDSDADGTFEPGGDDDQLYFAPSNNGTVEQGAWQSWKAAEGEWTLNGDGGPNTAVTLDEYLAEHPDARLINSGGTQSTTNATGAVDFQVGASGAGQRNGEFFLDAIRFGFVDEQTARTIGTDVFDLEPTLPKVSVSNASAREANSGLVPMTFTVSLDKAYADDVTVPFRTKDGTAKAGSDYNARTGSVTVPAGQTSATVTVNARSDKAYERTEAMSLVLGTPSFGVLADGTGTGTIRDNDTRVVTTPGQARGLRISAFVDTVPARGGAPVTVLGGKVGTKERVLFNGRLNASGELRKVLAQTYKAGTKVRVRSKVFTVEGTYVSVTRTITVR